jgi:periodic tryptophan protein 1
LVAAKTEDEVSQLEIYIYEEAEDNLYVHHDILLPSFPLCLEWLDFRLGRKAGIEGSGNYIAVGTFDPEIEIWDLDTLDSMYPDAILGKQQQKKKKKSKVRIFFFFF